jgi:hypothetical protein
VVRLFPTYISKLYGGEEEGRIEYMELMILGEIYSQPKESNQ